MTKAERASRLRQEAQRLRAAREPLEVALLSRRRLLDACLVRKVLPGRQAPAYYLAWNEGGRTRFQYLRQAEHAHLAPRAEAWREVTQLLVRWTRLSRALERCLRQLRAAQVAPW